MNLLGIHPMLNFQLFVNLIQLVMTVLFACLIAYLAHTVNNTNSGGIDSQETKSKKNEEF